MVVQLLLRLLLGVLLPLTLLDQFQQFVLVVGFQALVRHDLFLLAKARLLHLPVVEGTPHWVVPLWQSHVLLLLLLHYNKLQNFSQSPITAL